MTRSYLQAFAQENANAEIQQDKHYILKMTRFTPNYGLSRTFTIHVDTFPFYADSPEFVEKPWHIYTLSDLNLTLFGVSPEEVYETYPFRTWIPLTDLMGKNAATIVYTVKGRMLNLSSVYLFAVTPNQYIMAICIPMNPHINLDVEDVFVRTFTGSYYAANPGEKVEYVGTDAFAEWNLLSSNERSASRFYVDGWYIPEPAASDLVGATMTQFLREDAIGFTIQKNVEDIKLNFLSETDKIQKLLITSGLPTATIHWQDNIDVHVIGDFDGVKRGVYIHKNSLATFRNVTHHDYSIAANVVTAAMRTLADQFDPQKTIHAENYVVQLTIKLPAEEKSIIYDVYRLKELSKLSGTQQRDAMLGANASVSFWRAASLEASPYLKLLGMMHGQGTNRDVVNALGYFASAWYTNPSFIRVTPGQPVEIPVNCRNGCTVYEYNEDGEMFTSHKSTRNLTYEPSSANAAFVEFIPGYGSYQLKETVFPNNMTVTTNETLRLYTSLGTNYPFVDETDKGYVQVENGQTKWLNTVFPFKNYILRSDGVFYACDFKIRPNSDILQLLLISERKNSAGVSLVRPMEIPMGQMDVFMKVGQSYKLLIQGLDYFVDFPRVVITNKEYLEMYNDEIDVHVRMVGHCKKDLSLYNDADYGFVEHGYLSNNTRYDLRDGRSQLIVVNGQVKLRDEVEFSEEHSGVSIVNADNGKPYMVRDSLLQTVRMVQTDPYELRAQDRARDQEISDYLTIKLPEEDRGELVIIPQQHRLYSPFVYRLLTYIDSKTIRLKPGKTSYTRNEVVDICKQYEGLLEVDPLAWGLKEKLDLRYVSVDPHPFLTGFGVTQETYAFIDHVNKYYFNSKMGLTSLIITH